MIYDVSGLLRHREPIYLAFLAVDAVVIALVLKGLRYFEANSQVIALMYALVLLQQVAGVLLT